jgi:hypothetical protein
MCSERTALLSIKRWIAPRMHFNHEFSYLAPIQLCGTELRQQDFAIE